MPTYEYICSACGHAFERFESITSKPNKDCPQCKKKKAERQISGGAGLIFKGSGFYVTDYKKKGSDTKTNDTPAKSDAPATATPAASGGSTSSSTSTPPATSTPAPAAPAKASEPTTRTSKPVTKKK